jgi:hypothetical protein
MAIYFVSTLRVTVMENLIDGIRGCNIMENGMTLMNVSIKLVKIKNFEVKRLCALAVLISKTDKNDVFFRGFFLQGY